MKTPEPPSTHSRTRTAALAALLLATYGTAELVPTLATASVATDGTEPPGASPVDSLATTMLQLASASGALLQEIHAAGVDAERWGVDTTLALQIRQHAREENVDTDIAFSLIFVESSFRPHVASDVGAVGLTQILPSTARWMGFEGTTEELYGLDANLTYGLRYLRWMLDAHDQDVRLALLAYNRGPGTVAGILRRGEDPANGYARKVLGA